MASSRYQGPEGQKVNIEVCGCCGGKHELIELRSYVVPKHAYTHYFFCPKKGDPVSVCIRQLGTRVVEAGAKIVDALVNAENAGPYMVAVFSPENDKIRLDRISWNFSQAQYDTCVETLRYNLRRETHPPERADIQPAARPPAMLDLYPQTSPPAEDEPAPQLEPQAAPKD